MLRQLDIILYTLTKDEYIGEGSSKMLGGGGGGGEGHKVLVVVITPFGVLLLVYKADASARRNSTTKCVIMSQHAR